MDECRKAFEEWWAIQATGNIHINSAIGNAAYQAWQAAWDYPHKHLSDIAAHNLMQEMHEQMLPKELAIQNSSKE